MNPPVAQSHRAQPHRAQPHIGQPNLTQLKPAHPHYTPSHVTQQAAR